MKLSQILLPLTLLVCLPAFPHGDEDVPDNGKAGNLDSVNGGINIGRQAEAGDIDTVNGSIRIGQGSKVGLIDAVNGGINLEDGASARAIDNVNGGIRGGEKVRIEQGIDSVNGGINLKAGSSVGKDVANVNGQIELTSVAVGGNVDTVNGPVTLAGTTVIEGQLILRKSGNWCFWDCDSNKPVITIGPDVEIKGGILLEREATLNIDPKAKVGKIDHAYKK